MSHIRTDAVQHMIVIRWSLDYIVGSLQEERRHVDTERLSSLEVDHEFEPGRLLHWQIGWLGPL